MMCEEVGTSGDSGVALIEVLFLLELATTPPTTAPAMMIPMAAAAIQNIGRVTPHKRFREVACVGVLIGFEGSSIASL